MPFITFTTGQKLDQAKKDELKTMFGKNISLLPGKSEKSLMVNICDDQCMYFGGTKGADIAEISIKLYQMSPLFAKQEFTKKVFEDIDSICGIKKDKIFLNFVQFDTWGSGGILK